MYASLGFDFDIAFYIQKLIYVICVFLCIAVSNIYCVVFLFCVSSSCVPYVASFSGLFMLDYLFGIL